MESAPYLTIIGEGPERGRLEALATRLGVDVKFLGRLSHEDTLRELSQAALLALPSRRTRDGDSDGFANVLTEAMMLGVPIVTTDAAGAGELLVDGESAIIIPCGDGSRGLSPSNGSRGRSPSNGSRGRSPSNGSRGRSPSMFADAINRLLADLPLQKRLADNARRVLETRLNQDVEIEKTANLIFGKIASQKLF